MNRRAPLAVAGIAVGMGVLFGALALARYGTLHNETFDLAFYARMAWGLARLDGWDPIVGAFFLGLHVSPVLLPLGVLGYIFDTSAVLLVAQAATVALAAFPLARMGIRRFGTLGGTMGAVLLLLHPNVGHVLTFEFHPGTLAILPLAWAADALDRRDARGFAIAIVFVLLCREDLALVTAILGVLAFRADSSLRPIGRRVALGSLAYVLLFAAVLHPLFAPSQGSLEAHFGVWGRSAWEILGTWLSEPDRVLAHLVAPERRFYLPAILLPLGLLPLLAPRYLLATAPIHAINLLSAFPGTADIDSHYITPALPLLVAGALEGGDRLRALVPGSWTSRLIPGLAIASVGLAHLVSGGIPLGGRFDAAAFRIDEATLAGRRILSQIPAGASVQAPDPLLPHLAERRLVHRAPPPERKTDYVVLDLSHRTQWAGQETLLRTKQEPLARTWLARTDHALLVYAAPYALLARGGSPDDGIGRRAVVGTLPVDRGLRLTSCLRLVGAELIGSDRVTLDLVATAPCPSDLALRFDRGLPSERTELLAGGLLSPSHLRTGDHVRSVHFVQAAKARRWVWVGAVRSSGSRPEGPDPTSIRIPIRKPQPETPSRPSAVVNTP